MSKRRIIRILIMGLTMMTLSMVAVVQAQTGATCEAVVSQSLTDLATNCANLSRNETCLGHEEVTHTAFASTVPEDFYTQAGDRADLLDVESIQTAPFDLAEENLGLNVMNVAANLPHALSQKGVIFLQFGGVEVENGVEPESALQLVNGISLTTTAGTDLLTWPPPSVDGHSSETILAVPAGATVSIDAIDPTQRYGRAVYQSRVGWVSLAALNATGVDLNGLPAIGADSFTPMQNFYLRTGIGGTPCADAPSLLFVQSPSNVTVDLQVFDEPIRIGSAIVLRTVPPGDQLGNSLEIVTLSGLAVLYPDTDHEVIVPPGHKSIIPLCDPFLSLGIEGDEEEKAGCGNWSSPVPLTADELDELQLIENIPNNITSTTVIIPVLVPCSGSSGCESQLFFPDQTALNAAIAACQANELPDSICQYLGIS